MLLNRKPNGVKVYAGVKMTGRDCYEVVEETEKLVEALENAGFTVLSPVLEEKVPKEHRILCNEISKLREHWKRDKEMLQEAHIMLDFNSQGTSDGVNVEMGLIRFGYWKPLVRVHPCLGAVISRIEYDCVASTLEEALVIMQERWGTKEKLFWWRMKMLYKSLPKFLWLQLKFIMEVI